jgi:acetolactate synthase-1/2/3 large subunit
MSISTTDQSPGVSPLGAAGQPFRENLNVAQLLLEYLKLEGETKIFGIPGGTVIYLMNEIKKQKDLDFVICRHETGAAYIATGYAITRDGVGVVLTTSGPAATNPLTGSLNAQASGVPMLVITGEVPQPFFGMGYLQEGIDARLDVAAVYKNAVKYSAVISHQAHAGTMIQEALRVSRSLPGTVSHLSLPNDVAASCVTSNLAAMKPHRIPFPTTTGRYRALPSGTDRRIL